MSKAKQTPKTEAVEAPASVVEVRLANTVQGLGLIDPDTGTLYTHSLTTLIQSDWAAHQIALGNLVKE